MVSLKSFQENIREYDESLRKDYEEALARNDRKIIVLDDDPTGTQTVHDVYVYTSWEEETIEEAFNDGVPLSFILTNSRGLSSDETRTLHTLLGKRINAVAKRLRKEYILISRSDSTLRGHYPLETETLKDSISDTVFDGEIIMPFFLEGGRYTLNDVHYVGYKDDLIPAGESEFALDKTFGYRSSNLKDWIEEKSEGRFPASSVVSITLSELRNRDYEEIEKKLLSLSSFGKLIVNALTEDDVISFSSPFFHSLDKGRHFIIRSAASLVKVLGGVATRPLLEKEELPLSGENGGLIIAGSHVKKTTRQLEELKKMEDIVSIEINQHLVLDEKAFNEEMDRVVDEARRCILSGKTCTVSTRRERFDINTGDKEDELRIALRISDAVTSIVPRLGVRPRYIVAKGGITSSEIGKNGLGCRKAYVLGQIKKGIPVWRTGDESLYPGLTYVIFPGNVGDDYTLRRVVETLEGK